MPEQLPEPRQLSQAVVIHFHYGDEQLKLLCTAFTITNVNQQGFDNEPCLIMKGCRLPIESGVPEVGVLSFILPARYITYVGIGPRISVIAKKPGDRIVIQPVHPKPPGAMTLDAIEAALKELSLESQEE